MTRIVLAVSSLLAMAAWSSQPVAAGTYINTGWGCHTCGFKNGTALTGHRLTASGTVSAIVLPSGEAIIID
jgi:hypothetical protein